MSHGPRRLTRLPSLPSADAPVGVADAELLARWAQHRDEAAFELLVRRYAPLVLALCRRVLADANDADDAFQATFLVLARKASAIQRAGVLAAWLHRVACRVAVRVRADRSKRGVRPESSIELVPARETCDAGFRELERVLDEEITGLPERQRAVVVLCCLEGKTGEEAGRLLGCAPGTVSSRLTRAREQLRARLTRRGFAPAAVASLAALSASVGAASPTELIRSTLAAASPFADGYSSSPAGPLSRPASLAQGVIRTMTATQFKLAALLILTGLVAVGGVLAATQVGGEKPQLPITKLGGEKVADEKRPAVPAVPVVRVVRPEVGGLDRVARVSGTAEAVQQARLFPKVAGELKSLRVDIGDTVKAEQVLAELDVPAVGFEFALAAAGVKQAEGFLHEAEARLLTARAEVEASKSGVRQREAEAQSAKATIVARQRALDRVKELVKQGTVSTHLVDEAEGARSAAQATADGATAGVESAKVDVEVKKGKLVQAEANVATAKSSVEIAVLGMDKARAAQKQAVVVAPFDGVVTKRAGFVGDHAHPADRADAVPLLTIVRTDRVRVVIGVAERDIPLVKRGVRADVTFGSALGNLVVTDQVARVGYEVDPTTHSMRVEVDVPNVRGEIRPGMHATVTLTLGKGPADALRVPISAVVTRVTTGAAKSVTGVYVYCNGRVRLTAVQFGTRDGTEAEVLSGLTVEDRVVLNGAALPAGDEMAVELEKPTPPK